MKHLPLGILFFFVIAWSACKKTETPQTPDIPFERSDIEVIEINRVPLSTRFIFTTNQEVRVSMRVMGRNGSASDVERDFETLTKNHDLPILGLYADTINQVELKYFDAEGSIVNQDTIPVPTGSIPEKLPEIIIEVPNTTSDQLFFLVSFNASSTPSVPFIFDQFGDIRWFLVFPDNLLFNDLYYDVGLERLQNGNWYFGNNYSAQIYEVDMLGEHKNTWDMPGYSFHHNVQERPNGNLLVTSTKFGNTHQNGAGTVEDAVIEIDRNSGAIVREWNFLESLDENRVVLINNLGNDPIDWLHVNAVQPSPIDEDIVISGRTQGVFKLSPDNQVQWILGNHRGWGNNRNGEDLNQYLLQPLDANGQEISDTDVLEGYTNHPDFEWPWYQHAHLFMPNGNLMLFDNGFRRNYLPGPYYSRAVEYKIDAENRTVQQVWEYGSDRPELNSQIVSDVDYLPEDNSLIMNCGQTYSTQSSSVEGRIVKIDYSSKEVLFDARVYSPTSSYFVFHRAEQVTMYPD